MTIDDRHLVGVSESEKKRRARLLVDAAAQDLADASDVLAGPWRGSTKSEVLADVGPAIYAGARRIYRIGERLRPCTASKALRLRGCKACVPLCPACVAGLSWCPDCWNRRAMPLSPPQINQSMPRRSSINHGPDTCSNEAPWSPAP